MTIQRLRADRSTRLRRQPTNLYAVIFIVAMSVGIGLGIVAGLLITLHR